MNTCNTICYSYLCHETYQTGSVLRKIAGMVDNPVEGLLGIKVAGNTHSNIRIHSSLEDSEQLKGWKEDEMKPIFFTENVTKMLFGFPSVGEKRTCNYIQL